MKELAAVIFAVLLAGCGSVRYPTSYLLNLPAPAPRTAPPQAVLGPIAVRSFGCPEYICEGRIVFRPGPEEVGFYEHHRWAISPREAITRHMADALRSQSLFKSVAVHERGLQPAYVLTGNIERLEESDQGHDVRAVCTISAQLIDGRTGSVVWSHTASEAVAVQNRDVAGVVSSLSAAARIAVDSLVASVSKELASSRTD
ncbi:MAG TPA: ABC-type transport auxiliary lipoprotein family protein [Bryobacteraceae bacterium]|nr:ABC-type transport auxiliary lipoprotein family protein [Bryobacteraceae bacterium]